MKNINCSCFCRRITKAMKRNKSGPLKTISFLSGWGYFFTIIHIGGNNITRAGDNEKVKHDIIDEKKLTTIMKRFLGTKEGDPEVTKFFKVENGINFMATTFGSAVQIYFKNKFEGSFVKGTGKTFFRKPMPNSKFEDTDFIAEMETITEGKKKIKKPTGRFLEYPDVSGMFKNHNLDEYYCIDIPAERADDFIAVHESMEKAAKVGGMYNTAELFASNERLLFKLYDSVVRFEWNFIIDNEDEFVVKEYHYDFSLMVAIFKSLKDMKVSKIHMYIKDKNHPILFVGQTTDYSFNFAVNRKLVGVPKE